MALQKTLPCVLFSIPLPITKCNSALNQQQNHYDFFMTLTMFMSRLRIRSLRFGVIHLSMIFFVMNSF